MNTHIQKIIQVLSKNSPTILTGFAVAGLISTVVIAVRATPAAMTSINEAEWGKGEVRLTKKELVQYTWKIYIPSALMGAATIGCIIGANQIGMRRNAALAGLYSLTESTLKEYQQKVVDTIGEKKEQKIQDEIAQDRITNNPPKAEEIISTGKGETLCYDWLSGRYFKSDIEKIRKAENELNKDLLADNFISLNEVYDALGLPPIGIGEELGWSLWIDDGDDLVSFTYSSQLTDAGKPCLVLKYAVVPRYDYMDKV